MSNDIAKIKELHAAGKSIAEICKILDAHPKRVDYVINNE
jgi:hypothetical protein